jgi:hypothetical protein
MLVKAGLILCALPTIPVLLGTICVAGVLILAVIDQSATVKYLKPFRPDVRGDLILLAVSVIVVVTGLFGCGLLCVAPPRAAARAARIGLALMFVSLACGLAALIGIGAVLANSDSDYLGLVILLTLTALSSIAAAQTYHLLSLKTLGSALSADGVVEKASFMVKLAIAALFLTIAVLLAVSAYGSFLSFEESQRSLGRGIMGLAARAGPAAPDPLIPMLAFMPVGLWALYFINYLILVCRAYAAISSRPSAAQSTV